MKTYRDLSYIDLSHNRESISKDVFEKSYKFWKSGWTDTFRALGVSEKAEITSNDFYYRKPNLLFYDGNPIAIYLSEHLSINQVVLDLDYFGMYSSSFIEFLRSRFKTICTISSLYIDPQWRKGSIDVPLGDVLFGIAVKNFVQCEAAGFISCVRDNRGVNKIFSRFGARTLDKGSEYNVDVSFMYLDVGTVKPHDNHQINKAVDYLWSTQTTHTEVGNEQRAIKATYRSIDRGL